MGGRPAPRDHARRTYWAPYAGLEVGPKKGGWALWATGTANSFKTSDLEQAGVSVGFRLDF